MSRRTLVLAGCVALVSACGAVAYASSRHEPIAIKWLLPHPPEQLFTRATEIFADEVEKKSDGRLILGEALLPQEAGVEQGDHNLMLFLDREPNGIATEYVGHLAGMHDVTFYGLDLPFLFEDYEGAMRFLDSPSAYRILDELSKDLGYRALAFTMSGGFRLIVSKERPIHTIQDLKGLRVFSGFGGLVPDATWQAMAGYVPENDPKIEFVPSKEKLRTLDAFETTYSRMYTLLAADPTFIRYVTETNHSLSLTVVLVKDEFFNALSERDQRVLTEAVRLAAKAEKEDSIQYEETVRQKLRSIGTTIITLTPEARASFKEATRSVREAYDPRFSLVVDAVAGTHE